MSNSCEDSLYVPNPNDNPTYIYIYTKLDLKEYLYFRPIVGRRDREEARQRKS